MVNTGLRGKGWGRPAGLSEEGCQRPLWIRVCGQDWVIALGAAGRFLLIEATDWMSDQERGERAKSEPWEAAFGLGGGGARERFGLTPARAGYLPTWPTCQRCLWEV